MVDRKRSLRPLETLKKQERSQLYDQIHEMVKNYRYESQAIRLLNFEHDQRILEEKLEEKIQYHKEKTGDNQRELLKIEREKKEKFSETDQKRPKIDEYDMKENKEKVKNQNEEKQIKIREEEIEKKKKEINEKKEELNQILNKIDIYQKYERVLESVHKKYEDYNDINDLINRYRTLKHSVNNLEREYSDIEKKNELEKIEFNKQEKFNKETIESQSTQVQKIEKEIEKLKKEIADGQKSQEQNRFFEIDVKAKRAKNELIIKNLKSKADKTKISKKKIKKVNEEEVKEKSGKIDGKKNSRFDDDIEDPEELVKMLRQIEERYSDLKQINEWLDQKTRENQTIPEEHLLKTKSQKKNMSLKKVEI